MKLELKAIDDSNRDAVESLEVADRQTEYIASNKQSLETALNEQYREIARAFAIYQIIGFTMFAFELTSSDPNDRYWLWRFMIDKDMQGRGYGSAALEKIIEYFKSHGANHILLSTKKSNSTALSLYHKYHFTETGDTNDGEIVLRLNL